VEFLWTALKNLNGKLFHQHDNGNSIGIISTFNDTKLVLQRIPSCSAKYGEMKEIIGVEFGLWGEFCEVV
jgi:hypothetical protein